MKLNLILTFFISTGFSILSFGQIDTINNSKLSIDAPIDKGHYIEGSEKQRKYDQMIAPYIEQARKTLPDAKKRFLLGLKSGEVFYLVTRIYDKDGKFEQVFVRVKDWHDDDIKGLIENELYTVKEYHNGQLIVFKEKGVYDWLISKPDGSEEGNFIGKYLDSVQK